MEDNFIVTSTTSLAGNSNAEGSVDNKDDKETKTTEVDVDSDESVNEVETDQESDESDSDENKDVSAEEEETDNEDQMKKKKSKGGFKRKIDRLQRENELLREKALRYEMELELKASGGKEKSKDDSKEVADKKPDINDFDSVQNYYEALSDWKAEQKVSKAINDFEKKLSAVEEKKKINSVVETYNSRVNEFKKEAKDFESVVSGFVEDYEGKISTSLQKVIFKSENGPKLVYALAKDTAEFERINSLDVEYQIYELGKLEARLSLASKNNDKTQTKKITSAPSPASTVKPKETVLKKDISDPSLSFAEYEKIMNERQFKRR